MKMHDDATRCGVEQVYKNLLWAHKPWFKAKIDKKKNNFLGHCNKGGHRLHNLTNNNHLMLEIQQMDVRGFWKKVCSSPFTPRRCFNHVFWFEIACLVYTQLFFLVNEFELCMYICKKLYIELLLNIYLHIYFCYQECEMCTVSALRMLIFSFDL
jgi:hypothetical protein